jgi:hypothetical protein
MSDMGGAAWEAKPLGVRAVWAIAAIVLIATIYEVNRKVGIALTVLALMAMALTYVPRFGLRFETSV